MAWDRHAEEWRSPAQVASHWQEAAATDPALLEHRVSGAWWEVLAERDITLLVTREYEHLVIAMGAGPDGPRVSYLRTPHPSGLVADRAAGLVHLASTRNPNQVLELVPVEGLLSRPDVKDRSVPGHPLIPVRSHFLPGALYLHDLALVGGVLHANAVGQNAVITIDERGHHPVWWPRCIEVGDGPVLGRNHLQLNSIAAGPDLEGSYFSASAERISSRRPGHLNFAVDRRGVVFSGRTREPVVRGLTRPHSARLHEGRVWVDNSGYGELVVQDGEGFTTVTRLPGWTRGLCFHDDVAIVGTSLVIPRFRRYAPGLDVASSVCGLHAVDTRSGAVLGSLNWPHGNQIFAIDWVPAEMSAGLPFSAAGPGATSRELELFYAFTTPDDDHHPDQARPTTRQGEQP